jgi:SAM-dependent methyltransferase
MNEKYIDTIVKHYESCLEKHGDSHLGVDWPKLEDVAKRYNVMIDMIRVAGDKSNSIKLLDFGCGAAHLLDYLREHSFNNIVYAGLDISEKFIALSRSKFPYVDFYLLDILKNSNSLPFFDYVVMNGVFTEKREMRFEEMWEYFCKVVTIIFGRANKGIAFNLMSKAVEWEREDLFYVPTDMLIDFLSRNLTRKFILRNDYGLYEYTTYVFK